MKKWNPFGKVDMEIGSFLKKSPFNKEYSKEVEADKNDEIKPSESEEAKKEGPVG
ncbi:MAG: hypothetical protein Q8942_14590 [Bacillota bacterium]|nr:hypothetical protein [Bacillota bacterium]